MMNAQEFAKTLQDATDYFGYTSRTLGPEEQEWVDSGNSTDWLDLVLGNGVQTQHTLSLQGGNKNENHYISLGYSNQEGNIKPEKFERYSLSGKSTPRSARYSKWAQHSMEHSPKIKKVVIMRLSVLHFAFAPPDVLLMMKGIVSFGLPAPTHRFLIFYMS